MQINTVANRSCADTTCVFSVAWTKECWAEAFLLSRPTSVGQRCKGSAELSPFLCLAGDAAHSSLVFSHAEPHSLSKLLSALRFCRFPDDPFGNSFKNWKVLWGPEGLQLSLARELCNSDFYLIFFSFFFDFLVRMETETFLAGCAKTF